MLFFVPIGLPLRAPVKKEKSFVLNTPSEKISGLFGMLNSIQSMKIFAITG
jgi:hypothetical protein